MARRFCATIRTSARASMTGSFDFQPSQDWALSFGCHPERSEGSTLASNHRFLGRFAPSESHLMLVSVALPLPLYRPLTYVVPDALAKRVAPGSRVVVPVRRRREMGFVVGEGAIQDGVSPKPLLEAPDERPLLDSSILDLCR